MIGDINMGTCFICPRGNGRMCSGGCGLECDDCLGERE